MITQKTTHAQEMVQRLLQQFHGQPKTEALISALGTRVQEVETAIFTILSGTPVLAAVGVQLDNFGTIVGLPRNGMDDATYRLFLRARILVLISAGTIEDLIEIMDLLTGGAETIVLTETPATDPAYFLLEVTTPIDDTLNDLVIGNLVLDGKSAGVRGITKTKHAPTFKLDTPGAGMDQGNKMSTTVGR